MDHQPVSTDPDRGQELAHAAARNDPAALDRLVAEHGDLLWRLAGAVAADAAVAEAAVAEGVSRALRSLRHHRRPADTPVRSELMAGTYAAALDLARRPGQAERDAAATAEGLKERSADHVEATALTAFRALPERWRAAVWLNEVEGMDAATIAAALDVSGAVALQLTVRGRRGLLNRFTQAGEPHPLALAPLLRPLVGPVPATLAATVAASWKASATSDPAARIPGAAWLADKAPRPLAATSAAIIALGIIGLGVLGGHGGLPGNVALGAPGAPDGTASGVASQGSDTYQPVASIQHLFALPASYGTSTFGTVALAGAPGATGGSGAGTTSGTGGGTGQTTTGTPGSATTTDGGTAPSGGSPAAPAPRPGTPAPTTPPLPINVTPTTVGPIGVGTGGGTVTVSVPPAKVSVGNCTEVALPGVVVPVLCPAPTTPVTLPPVTLPPVTLPPVTLPPVTVPTVTVPPVTIPAVTLPPVTLPGL